MCEQKQCCNQGQKGNEDQEHQKKEGRDDVIKHAGEARPVGEFVAVGHRCSDDEEIKRAEVSGSKNADADSRDRHELKQVEQTGKEGADENHNPAAISPRVRKSIKNHKKTGLKKTGRFSFGEFCEKHELFRVNIRCWKKALALDLVGGGRYGLGEWNWESAIFRGSPARIARLPVGTGSCRRGWSFGAGGAG